jgi:hypothetical protein
MFMFGFLLGTARKDLEVAKIINLYFGTFFQTYSMMGMDGLIGMIKKHPLVTDYKDGADTKSFFVGEELSDFHLMLANYPIPEAIPMLIAMGLIDFKGLSANLNLTTGKMMVSCKRTKLTIPT